jgi:hypothetical protein
LPDLFDLGLISIRSSATDRCVHSLISFINAMYPPTFIDALLTIQTSANREALRPSSNLCEDLLRETAQSDEFHRCADNAKKVQKPFYDHLNITWKELAKNRRFFDLQVVHGRLNSTACHGCDLRDGDE